MTPDSSRFNATVVDRGTTSGHGSQLCLSALALIVLMGQPAVQGCDLCAITSATNARGESTSGLVFSVAEQYISAHNLQFEGRSISVFDPEYLDSSTTHLVPGYNFTESLGLSLNIPVITRSFRIYDLAGGRNGTISGLGDTSLIGRWQVFSRESMKRSYRANLLAGVKFPTGDADQVRQDVALEDFFNSFFPTGHDHAISGVHPHDLALGSGSFDGVFGASLSGRWSRYFLAADAQYYLRTKGESGFAYGDTVMLSGGPGAYVWLDDDFTVSLQAVALHETTGRSSYSGKKSNQTGMTATYLGPQAGLTVGGHFSFKAGVDVPVRIDNNGLQSVPDYRIHGTVAWRF